MAHEFKPRCKAKGGERMIFPFKKEQAEFIRKTFGVNPSADMSDEEQLRLEDLLSDYLQTNGINEAGDGENETGSMCADILTLIADHDHA